MNLWIRHLMFQSTLASLFLSFAVAFPSKAGDIPTASPHPVTSGAPAVRVGGPQPTEKASQPRLVPPIEALSNDDLMKEFMKLNAQDPKSPESMEELQKATKEIRKRGLEGKLREKKGGETYQIKR